MNPTYLGDIDLNEETLAHYGIKGMKWGKRLRKAIDDYRIKRKTKKRNEKYTAQHLAEDRSKGKRYIKGGADSAGAMRRVFDQNFSDPKTVNSLTGRILKLDRSPGNIDVSFKQVGANTSDGKGNKKYKKTKYGKFAKAAANQEVRRYNNKYR